jgi:hypothetical protein
MTIPNSAEACSALHAIMPSSMDRDAPHGRIGMVSDPFGRHRHISSRPHSPTS